MASLRIFQVFSAYCVEARGRGAGEVAGQSTRTLELWGASGRRVWPVGLPEASGSRRARVVTSVGSGPRAYLLVELDPVLEGLDAELAPGAHRVRLSVRLRARPRGGRETWAPRSDASSFAPSASEPRSARERHLPSSIGWCRGDTSAATPVWRHPRGDNGVGEGTEKVLVTSHAAILFGSQSARTKS